MATKSQEIVAKDVADRLNEIAFHYEECARVTDGLHQFVQSDNDKASPRHAEMQQVIARVQREERRTLYELVHLRDNVRKYFEVNGLAKREIDVVELFKPYRVASSYVNTHKHGTRGRNKSNAKLDYSTLVYKRIGEKVEPNDDLLGICSLINFDGEIFDSRDLINCLVRIWEMFIRHHTEIDVQPFISRIGAVMGRYRGGSMYTYAIPPFVLNEAGKLATERKHANISG